MKVRNIFGITLSVLLLLLAPGSGLAREPLPTGLSETTDANTSAATNAPWFKFEVDTRLDTGQHVSVAVDPWTGRTYVSYYNAADKDLRVAQYMGIGGNCGPDDSWYCQTVDSEGDVGQYSSIAVKLGVVNISYHDAGNRDLKWAESSDNPYNRIWRIRTVDKAISPSSAGQYTSLKLPAVGSPRISYHFSDPVNGDELRIATYVGGYGNCGYGVHAGKWQCDRIQIGAGLGQYTSLALDGDGNMHIAYYDKGDGDLWYATSASGTNCGPGGTTWLCYPVTGSTTDAGKFASMYVDEGGRFHIAYYDATNDVLKYAVNVGSGGNCGVGGSAQCDTIDTMQADYHPLGISIAEDTAGYPIIAYQSYNGSLNVARPVAAVGLSGGGGNCGPGDLFSTWYCETIDRSGRFIQWRNGDYVSIAVNPAGLATIAYYRLYTDFTDGNLMVANQRLQIFLPLTLKDR